MIFFCEEFGVDFSFYEVAALGIAVWLIYILDHLRDAHKLPSPVAPRRKFHSKNLKTLLFISGIMMVIGVIICLNLSEKVLVVGSLVASISAFYLFLSKRIDWFKEFWVALSFSAGVLLIPLIRTFFSEMTLLVFVMLSVLALINLLLFSWFEKEIDEKEGFRSFASVFSERLVRLTIWLAFIIFLLLNIYGWQTALSVQLNFFFSSAGVLFLAIWVLPWFKRRERYRIAGDAIFIVPIVFLLF